MFLCIASMSNLCEFVFGASMDRSRCAAKGSLFVFVASMSCWCGFVFRASRGSSQCATIDGSLFQLATCQLQSDVWFWHG